MTNTKLEFICKEAREETNNLIKAVKKYDNKLTPEQHDKIVSLVIKTYKLQPYYAMLYYLSTSLEQEYFKNNKR